MARLVPLSNGLCCSCTTLVKYYTSHHNIHIAAQSSHLATLTLATCLSDNILGKLHLYSSYRCNDFHSAKERIHAGKQH